MCTRAAAAAAVPPPPVVAQPLPPVRAGTGDEVYVQAGAFAYYQNAIQVSNRLRGLGPVMVAPVRLDVGEMYRVRLGPVSTIDEAERLRVAAIDAGFPASRVVIE